VSVDTAAHRPASTTPGARTTSPTEEVRALLMEHRLARQDQIAALTFADPDDSSLDPGARLRVAATANRTLAEIEQALLRLEDGSYGFCLRCAEPVSSERLVVVPYTPYCVPCA
jgi:DnaK suppressor protein